jgi:hypothetical protein
LTKEKGSVLAMAMAMVFRSAPALAKISFLLSTTETRLAIAMAMAFRSTPALAKISFLPSTTETRLAMERRISFWATKSAKATPILSLRS